jgi:hypothetical protein
LGGFDPVTACHHRVVERGRSQMTGKTTVNNSTGLNVSRRWRIAPRASVSRALEFVGFRSMTACQRAGKMGAVSASTETASHIFADNSVEGIVIIRPEGLSCSLVKEEAEMKSKCFLGSAVFVFAVVILNGPLVAGPIEDQCRSAVRAEWKGPDCQQVTVPLNGAVHNPCVAVPDAQRGDNLHLLLGRC